MLVVSGHHQRLVSSLPTHQHAHATLLVPVFPWKQLLEAWLPNDLEIFMDIADGDGDAHPVLLIEAEPLGYRGGQKLE